MTKKITDIVLGLAICIFILSFSTVTTLNHRDLYYADAEKYQVHETVGLTLDEVKENYDVLIDYNSLLGGGELVFPDFYMSEGGEIHFEEVRAIFVGIQIMAIITFFVLILGFGIKIKNHEYKFLLYGSVATVVIPLVLGIAVAINWEWAFVTFHEIAFSNDYWIFDPNLDPVIMILPSEFFMHCAIMIVTIALVLSAVCAFLFYVLKRRNINKLNEKT